MCCVLELFCSIPSHSIKLPASTTLLLPLGPASGRGWWAQLSHLVVPEYILLWQLSWGLVGFWFWGFFWYFGIKVSKSCLNINSKSCWKGDCSTGCRKGELQNRNSESKQMPLLWGIITCRSFIFVDYLGFSNLQNGLLEVWDERQMENNRTMYH